MNQDKPSAPKSAAEARREREAEALRENLRKRKEQRRAREAEGQAVVAEPREDDTERSAAALKPPGT
jgi:hypothetical protein